MKKIAIWIGAVIGLLIVVAIVLPFVIPVDRYKSEITERTRAATGRDLVIAGPLSFRLLPSISLTAGNVSFSNVPGGKARNMATLDTLRVSVRFLPLLKGELQIDGFELVNPVIALEVDKNGKGNWEMAGASTPQQPAPAASGKTDLSFLEGLSLDDVKLTNGKVTYYDAATDKTMEVSAINASLSLPAFDREFKADGRFTWQGKEVSLDATLASLKGFLAGQGQPFTASVQSQPVTLNVNGTATMADSPSVSGVVDLNVPSVRDLAAWAGTPLTMPGTGLGPLAISGKLDYAGSKASFSDATLALDDIKATGGVAFDTGGARPKVTGELKVATLDLNPYLPPPAPAAPAQQIVWSDTPIDASGLKAADLDFTFAADAIKVMTYNIGESQLHLTLNNGVMTADLAKMALYQGTGSGTVTLNGQQPDLALKANFALAGVQAEPLLMDAAKMDRLTGTMETKLDVTATGNSQKALISALNGSGTVTFKDGEIRGVDLAKIASTIEQVVNGVSSNSGDFLKTLTSGNIFGSLQAIGSIFGAKGDTNAATKFTSLAGNWTAQNGVITNPDLLLTGPLVNNRALLKMTGAGTIDLPQQMINYETEIRSFSQAEAEANADPNKGGVGGTVRLTGMMTAPDACVVIGSLCIGKETKPTDLVKDKLLNSVTGKGGGKSPTDAAKSLGSSLKGLLGGKKK